MRSVLTFMSSFTLFILYVLSIYGNTCCGCRVDIEAEHGTSEGGTQMYNMRASNGITVLVKQGDDITFEFKVTPSTCQLTVDDVQYSNDGISDILVLYLNTTIIGNFTSKAAKRREIIQSSGQVGNPIEIFQGINEVQIVANSTYDYGVELDKISLQINCSNTSTVSGICPMSVVDTTGLIAGNTVNTVSAVTTVTTDSTSNENKLKRKDIITIASTVGVFILGLVGIAVSVVSVACMCCKKRRQELV